MLVLGRKMGESLVIDGGIILRVLDAGPGRVRVGIEAPAETKIRRAELDTSSRPEPIRAVRDGSTQAARSRQKSGRGARNRDLGLAVMGWVGWVS